MESDPGYFEHLRHIVTNAQPPSNIPPELQALLLQTGAIQLLVEEGSQTAVGLLEIAARNCPIPHSSAQALNGIRLLSMQGNPDALISIFQLALEDINLDAITIIQNEKFVSPQSWQNYCFKFLHGPLSDYQLDDPHLEKLLEIALTQAPPALQKQISERAQELGLIQWSQIAKALRDGTQDSLQVLIDNFNGYTQFEKTLTRTWLFRLALQASAPAQNALCELFLRWEDMESAQLATQQGFLPVVIERQVLFLFLTEQWNAYEILDFSHRYLVAAFEAGSTALRQRLLNHARITGHNDWLQTLGEARRRRWLEDMTDTDWQSVVNQINQHRSWKEAWQLVAHAPPQWSAELIELLFQADWHASTETDQLGFLKLVSLAQQARKKAPEVLADKILRVPAQNITATAMRLDGQVAATGGSDNRIYLWNTQSGERISNFLSSPAPGARALALSPDGLYLAAAFTDQVIRVYRLADQRLIKTLDGHSALIRSLFFHPDNRTLFSCSFDGTLRAWRFPLGPESARISPGIGELFSAAGNQEGNRIFLAGSQVQAWRWPSSELIAALPFSDGTILQLSHALDRPLIAGVDQNQTIFVWNETSNRLIQKIHTDCGLVSAISLTSGGDILLSGNKNGSIHLCNAFTGEMIGQNDAHERIIVGLHWTSSTAFLSASQDGRIIFWDARLVQWVRQPLDRLAGRSIVEIRSLAQDKSISEYSQAWAAFVLELIQFKNRFDILLDESGNIHLSEFDIEL